MIDAELDALKQADKPIYTTKSTSTTTTNIFFNISRYEVFNIAFIFGAGLVGGAFCIIGLGVVLSDIIKFIHEVLR